MKVERPTVAMGCQAAHAWKQKGIEEEELSGRVVWAAGLPTHEQSSPNWDDSVWASGQPMGHAHYVVMRGSAW